MIEARAIKDQFWEEECVNDCGWKWKMNKTVKGAQPVARSWPGLVKDEAVER
jgi:hypothetical protein